eukprot:c10148_g1_i2.p1 GENE.c10148_g1_i2~~c10148_g1_i2.p1  ORF type:complete len:136 (-),score=36.43 c10148_g1_i2:529-936(-)
MTELYDVIDAKHKLAPCERAPLDTVYWLELFCHVPVSWLCFFLLCSRRPSVQAVEMFLAGCQVSGTVAFYLPELLCGGHNHGEHPVPYLLGIVFGLLWIVFPVFLLVNRAQLCNPEDKPTTPAQNSAVAKQKKAK